MCPCQWPIKAVWKGSEGHRTDSTKQRLHRGSYSPFCFHITFTARLDPTDDASRKTMWLAQTDSKYRHHSQFLRAMDVRGSEFSHPAFSLLSSTMKRMDLKGSAVRPLLRVQTSAIYHSPQPNLYFKNPRKILSSQYR